MKLPIKSVNPKNLFRYKKPKSLSKSAPSSFNTAATSACSSPSSSSDHGDRKLRRASTTPTSVLLPRERYLSGELSDTAARRVSGGEWSDTAASAYASGGVKGGDIHLDLAEAFKMIDHDGDGKITRSEMEALLSRIAGFGEKAAPSEEEIATMLEEIDRDGDGCISFEEFGAISAAFDPVTGADELRETFDVFDADHDGKITAEELRSVFLAIGDERCTLEDCRRMIEGVDMKGDGFVCFEDFRRMMDKDVDLYLN